MKKKIQAVLADDHVVFRDGIKGIFETVDDVVVVGEAENGREAQRVCRELTPDVLLLDLKMSGPSPAETITYLREHCPEVKILILSGYEPGAELQELIALGIAGYVLKTEAGVTLVEAIRTVVGGGTWFSQSIMKQLIQIKAERLAGLLALTEREHQVLDLLAQGLDNAQIAAELDLAKQTVGNYLSQIYEKLGVRARGEAIVWARQHGLGEE